MLGQQIFDEHRAIYEALDALIEASLALETSTLAGRLMDLYWGHVF